MFFERSLFCSSGRHLFDKIYSKKILLQFKIQFLAAITPVSDDLSKIIICWFGVQVTFLIIINVEKKRMCCLKFLSEINSDPYFQEEFDD